jgi:hypothetical protein
MDGVVFVLHGDRVPLTSGERATLFGFTNETNEGLLHLRSAMRQAGDVGAEIVFKGDGERYALLMALDAAALDKRHFTPGLQRLHKAARVPITRPWER